MGHFHFGFFQFHVGSAKAFHLAHFLGIIHGVQHEPAFMRTQEDGVLAVVHSDFGDGDILTLFEGLGQQRIRTTARLFGHHVVRRFEIHGIDVAGLHEFEDLHGLGGLRLDLLDLVGLDHDVLIFAKLVALDDVTAVDHDIFRLTNVLLFEPRLVRPVQHVEGNAAAARSRKQAHRHGDKSEG